MDKHTEEHENIEIGSARADELDTMLAIMCEGFGLPFDAAREIFYSDPYFERENKIVLRVNGEVVSCLTIVDTHCWIGAGLPRLAGIAGVATRQDMRQRGYAGRLLRAVVATLHARGYPLTALFPFSQDYYRRFGWELAGYALHYLTSPANLHAYPEARSVRLARPEDIPDLVMLYTHYAEGHALHCPRDAKRWQFILDHVKQRVVYARHPDVAEGYLLYEHRPGQGDHAPPTLRILEMVAVTAPARRGLIGHLAAQTNVGRIDYTTSWQQLHDTGLLRFSAQMASGSTPVATIEAVPSVMVRVIDLEQVARALRREWSRFNGAVALRMNDGLLGPGTSLVTVIGTGDGEPEVEEVMPLPGIQDFENIVEGNVTAWSQVVVGHLSADDACELGLLHATTPHARVLAAELFPRRSPFLPIPDHF